MEYVEGRAHRRSAADRAGARVRRADLRSLARGAPQGHRAPRPEAGQHPADEAGRQAPRLRVGEAGFRGVGREPASHSAAERATIAALTGAHTVVGTPQYMAPEQIEGREVDARADVFAFGCVLYELLTGRRAFDGKSASTVMAAVLASAPTPARTARAADAAGARARDYAMPGEGSRRAMADREGRGGGAAMDRAGRLPRRPARRRRRDADARANALRGRLPR